MFVARKIFSKIFIPMTYVICAILLDIIMFIFLDVSFPKYYLGSLLLLMCLAGLVSCIPKRWVQITILGIFITFQMLTSIFNLIAMFNLNEIFNLETPGSFKEIFNVTGVRRYNALWHSLTLMSVVVVFYAVTISAAYCYRKHKAGYPARTVFATVCASMFLFGGFFANIHAMRSKNGNYLDITLSPGDAFATFHNRQLVLYSFGSPAYYLGNLFKIMGAMSVDSIAAGVNWGWEDVDYYDDYKDSSGNSLMLDENTNLIMLAMETVEYNAINPALTENIYKIQNMSTWVDGLYNKERTCFSEHTALTGGHVMGSEMWRDYRAIERPQSLPNIFREAFSETSDDFQIGAFHGYDKTYYSRDKLFPYLGFDFIKDQTDYGGSYKVEFNKNSDIDMFTKMLPDIAPRDKSFFSYILNISTHTPHYHSEATYIDANGVQAATSNINAAVDKYTTVLHPDSLNHIMTNYDTLAAIYPRLYSEHNQERYATVAYLTSLREYDSAVGVLLDHLMATEDEDGNPVTPLIQNTAIVMFSDHYDYMAYGHFSNISKGGALSPTLNSTEYAVGEKLSFIVYNPKDTDVITDITGKYKNGRKIECFMSNNDIYKTVAHMYNIQTNKSFTLGNSVFTRHEDFHSAKSPGNISVAIGFYNYTFLGFDGNASDPSNGFSTKDFMHFDGKVPDRQTLEEIREQANIYAGTLFKLRSYYDNNNFRNDEDTYYQIGGQRHVV